MNFNIFSVFSPVLKSEKNTGYSVFVLPPLNQTLSPCIYDVALISNTATNDTLCLYLEGYILFLTLVTII